MILAQFFNTIIHVHIKDQLQRKHLEKNPLPTLPKNSVPPSTSHTPIKTIPEHTASSPFELSSFTFSHIYPRLEILKSTTASSLTDLSYKD